MQDKITRALSEKSIYSIKKYQGKNKWCFAIILNKAKDNYEDNPNILNESLIRFEKKSKQDWFDEETKELILKNKSGDKDKYQVKEEIKEAFKKSLSGLRNYFSHCRHTEDCLYFDEKDEVRIIMERAYDRAKLAYLGKEINEGDTYTVPLFQNDTITTAGVILFISFFVEMSILVRLLGRKEIKGFTQTEGKYNITRKIISHYALRGSYSVKPEHNTKMFRDILGYLLRIPSKAYRYYYPDKPDWHKDDNDNVLTERKTEKFISFAASYLEDFSPRSYELKFARKKIYKPEEDEDTENKPHKKKAKVRIQFDGCGEDDPYYINHNNVVLRIIQNQNEIICKVGVNELKYLVLLYLGGNGTEALGAIAGYVEKIRNIDKFNKASVEKDKKYIPRFILRHYGVEKQDEKNKIEKRKEYIQRKWQEKKKKSEEARLDSKTRDILQYLNECGERPFNVDEYNNLFEILINKDYEGFQKELTELIRTERIEKGKIQDFMSLRNLEQIHQKVCSIIIQKLEQLEGDVLLEYIGLKGKNLRKKDKQIDKEKQEKKEKQESKFENKIKKLRPVLCKGFLRDKLFSGDNKKFWELVQDALKQTGAYDILIDEKYYEISDRERFDKDNMKLWETKAIDRLCMMIAWEYYKILNESLAAKSEKIEWNKEDQITLAFTGGDKEKKIRFSIRDFTKMYVMDKPAFLRKLMEYFLPNIYDIEYHKLYNEGEKKYSDLQKECMTAILEFEKKVIKKKGLESETEQTHIDFKTIVDIELKNESEKESVKNIRNSIFHYNLDFERNDLRKFYDVMEREGIRRKWTLKL